MDYRNLYHFEVYYTYHAKELIQRADRERLALSVISGQRKLRFYYPAMVRFGHWLIVSGRRLQKRYGDICELPTSHSAQRSVS